jgi:hypothetical protein
LPNSRDMRMGRLWRVRGFGVEWEGAINKGVTFTGEGTMRSSL